MKSSLTRSSLPEDIIRRLVRIDEDLIAEQRLIAPSWNNIVLEFLSRPQFGILERAYLFAGDADSNDDSEKSLHLAAILPYKHATVAGVGSWLHVIKQYNAGTVEVSSLNGVPEDSQKKQEEVVTMEISRPEEPRERPSLLHCSLLFAVGLAHVVAFAPSILFYDLVGALSVVIYLYMRQRNSANLGEKRKEPANFQRLARFFSLFTTIESLVLEKSNLVDKDDNILDKVQRALGKIKINRLEIVETEVDGRLQLQIVELSRAHGIRHVFVQASYFDVSNFFDFSVQLAALGVRFDLYEQTSSNQLLYVGKSKLFWCKMTSELEERNIELKIATLHDSSFSKSNYDYRARVHVRVENKGNSEPLQPVESSRGFSLNSMYLI